MKKYMGILHIVYITTIIIFLVMISDLRNKIEKLKIGSDSDKKLSIAAVDEEETTKDANERHLETTSPILKRKYQKVNASLFAYAINPEYTGPHAGPGIIVGLKGPNYTVVWPVGANKDDQNDIPTRILPFSSILCIDKPITSLLKDSYVVYYRGPFGDTEFAVLSKKDETFFDNLQKRWQSYLLSQEPVK